MLEALTPGCEMLLDDGKLALRVTNTGETHAAEVVRGGTLTGRKSVKLPGKTLRLPVLTDRDVANIRRAADCGVTGLLQPLVHSGEELRQLRAILEKTTRGI